MTAENTQDRQPDRPAWQIPDDSAGYALAERAVWHLLEKNAVDPVVLDLRGLSDVCDMFVLATGTSSVQVKALAKHVHDELLAAGHRPAGVEGMQDGRWALLDFVDVVVHVFRPETREYYQLDRLWGDARRLDLAPAWFADPQVRARHPELNFGTVAATTDKDEETRT